VRRLAVLAAVAGALWLAPGALAAGWCGSGEQTANRPDTVTGRQVRTFVVVPADGADNFQVSAGQVADDVTSFSSWWTGQDPTRVPRFDLADFSGVNCLDTAFLRLAQPAAALSTASLLFDDIIRELGSSVNSVYSKELVYYDGPAPEVNVCGVGGGSFTGPGVAIVVPAGCPGVPTDTVAAHELLHAMGALPAGAPHPCPGDSGHPCDSTTDILYPYTHGEPLSQKVLDFGHDDYYGHSGGWNDLQDSGWLRHLDTPQQPLALTLVGAGTVTSDVPGVICAASCTTQWDQGSTINLSAEPSDATRFIGWKGACTGTIGCLLTLDAAKAATAVFGPIAVPVTTAVAGKGRVVCTPRCSKTFAAGRSLTLKAVPAKGWRFARWSGGCKGTTPICRPATNFAIAVKATFKRF
jgi:Divergent InlB B-repeat domain